MGLHKTTAAILAGMALAQAAPVQAGVQGFAGKVIGAQSAGPADIRLKHEGREAPLAAYALIFPGDVITVTGAGSRVQLVIRGERISVTAANSPYVVRQSGAGKSSARDDDYLSLLKIIWGGPRKAIPVYPKVRGDTPAPVLTNVGFLPATPQRIPLNYGPLALVWSGGPGPVRVAGRMVDPGDDRAWAVVPNSLTRGTAVLTVGGKLSWRIETTDAPPPVPPWFEPGQTSLTSAQRIVRAAWILNEGPGQWRLFALSEIAGLAGEDPVADVLWSAIRAGEFAPS